MILSPGADRLFCIQSDLGLSFIMLILIAKFCRVRDHVFSFYLMAQAPLCNVYWNIVIGVTFSVECDGSFLSLSFTFKS